MEAPCPPSWGGVWPRASPTRELPANISLPLLVPKSTGESLWLGEGQSWGRWGPARPRPPGAPPRPAPPARGSPAPRGSGCREERRINIDAP